MRVYRCLLMAIVAAGLFGECHPEDYALDQPPHDYWKRAIEDPFSRMKADLESGRVELDRKTEKGFVLSLLKALNVPVSSQMLVFSTTSLQLSLISPSNPRALYFNDDVYVGWVPGGRVEIVSMDPGAGGIFYIFNIPKSEQDALRVERSERCMNCHAGADSRNVPGLVIKSVIPGPGGGSLTAYRIEKSGHDIPLSDRFGGWYLTGAGAFTNHWGNLTGRLSPQGLTTYPILPGKRFDWERYPVQTSDLLAQLLHEHQAGFVNRVVEATYRTREWLHSDHGKLTPEHAAGLEAEAKRLTRYILFADEAPLPKDGVEGDSKFKSDFQRTRKAANNGASLRDLDLGTRLFKNRCSYMIYTLAFQGLPKPLKEAVYRTMHHALDSPTPAKEFAYLGQAEKNAINQILRETVPDWSRQQ
jgi:hypothetical protein